MNFNLFQNFGEECNGFEVMIMQEEEELDKLIQVIKRKIAYDLYPDVNTVNGVLEDLGFLLSDFDFDELEHIYQRVGVKN